MEKPSGGKACDDLLTKLLQVPKKELDKQVRKYKAKKTKKKDK